MAEKVLEIKLKGIDDGASGVFQKVAREQEKFVQRTRQTVDVAPIRKVQRTLLEQDTRDAKAAMIKAMRDEARRGRAQEQASLELFGLSPEQREKTAKVAEEQGKKIAEAQGDGFFAALKSRFGKGSTLGQWGALLKGGGALAAISLGGGVFDRATESMAKLSDEVRKGEKSASELTRHFLEGLPIVGSWVHGLGNLLDVFSGTRAYVDEITRATDLQNRGMELQNKLLEESLEWRKRIAKETRQLADRRELAGTGKDEKDEVSALQKNREELQGIMDLEESRRKELKKTNDEIFALNSELSKQQQHLASLRANDARWWGEGDTDNMKVVANNIENITGQLTKLKQQRDELAAGADLSGLAADAVGTHVAEAAARAVERIAELDEWRSDQGEKDEERRRQEMEAEREQQRMTEEGVREAEEWYQRQLDFEKTLEDVRIKALESRAALGDKDAERAARLLKLQQDTNAQARELLAIQQDRAATDEQRLAAEQALAMLPQMEANAIREAERKLIGKPNSGVAGGGAVGAGITGVAEASQMRQTAERQKELVDYAKSQDKKQGGMETTLRDIRTILSQIRTAGSGGVSIFGN